MFCLQGWAGIGRRMGPRRIGPHKGNSSRGDNPGKRLEVRKKRMCPGSFR